MEETFDKLRQLQDILSEKIRIERDIQEIPKVLDTQEVVLERYKKNFIDKNQEYEKMRAAAGEIRNLLFEAESSRDRAEKNIGQIEKFNQREYEILDKERLESTKKEEHYRRELQKEERRMTELNEEIKGITASIEQQEQELAGRRSFIENEIFERRKELEALEVQKDELATGLDEDLLFKFDRIVRHKMGMGIVAIKGGVCTGCHMILPSQFANEVRKGEEIVFCPYCSRILYYEDSEGDITEEDYFDNDSAGSLADLDDLDEDEDGEEEELINVDYE